MRVRLELVERLDIIRAILRSIAVDHLLEVLLAAGVVLVRRPVRVEFVAQLPVLLLLVGLLDERVQEQLGPAQPLTRRLVQQALQEGLELRRHVVGELDGVLDYQVNQRVDTVRVERWRPHEELVDDDSERPQVNGVVVGQLLHELWCHVQRRSLDRGEHDRVRGH